MKINIGLDDKTRKQITEYLSIALANAYVLYTMTQNFHWNLVDPRFYSLHLFMEKQYEDLAEGIDELAERIRKIGEQTPATLKHFLKVSLIKEPTENFDGDKMLKELLNGHETICRFLREHIDITNDLQDQATGDLFIKHLEFHEKSAWMLRSHFN